MEAHMLSNALKRNHSERGASLLEYALLLALILLVGMVSVQNLSAALSDDQVIDPDACDNPALPNGDPACEPRGVFPKVERALDAAGGGRNR